MNEFTTWMQNNWYALGNLLSQFAFLTAGVWFARKTLKTMRASQEQVGALLKLAVTGAITERHSSNASPYWLTPGEVPPVGLPEPHDSGPGRLAVTRHLVMAWLQTPMSRGAVAPWRRAIKWLQAPAGT